MKSNELKYLKFKLNLEYYKRFKKLVEQSRFKNQSDFFISLIEEKEKNVFEELRETARVMLNTNFYRIPKGRFQKLKALINSNPELVIKAVKKIKEGGSE